MIATIIIVSAFVLLVCFVFVWKWGYRKGWEGKTKQMEELNKFKP